MEGDLYESSNKTELYRRNKWSNIQWSGNIWNGRKDIEYANNIEIKTEKATDFIKDELIEKANKIFDRKMETYEEAVNEAKEKLMENKNFIKDIKKLN